MCGNDVSLADIELQAILSTHFDARADMGRGRSASSFEVDESQMAGMGKVSRKINVQLTLLRKLVNVFEVLKRSLIKTSSWNVYKDLEMPLVLILSEIEFRGIYVRSSALDSAAGELKAFMQDIESRVVSAVGKSYGQLNLQSPEQVATLLYDDLQLPRPGTTPKSRHASTSEKELTKLVDMHPVVNHILMYRTSAKILGTYIDGLRPFISNEANPRGETCIHACLNQTVASTGRLSCSRPNLQSIPKEPFDMDSQDTSRSCKQINPRGFVVAREGCIFLSIDYSQVFFK
jgi:DNA polymerase-1